MSTGNIMCDRSHWGSKSNPLGKAWPNGAAALDDATIAEFSAATISEMTDSELAQVIRASRLPVLAAMCDEHLEYQDRKTLERLVYLARRCCLNRTIASGVVL